MDSWKVQRLNGMTQKPFWGCPGFPHCEGTRPIYQTGVTLEAGVRREMAKKEPLVSAGPDLLDAVVATLSQRLMTQLRIQPTPSSARRKP